MIEKRPTPDEIDGLNRYVKEPFPRMIEDWTNRDYERFRKMQEQVVEIVQRWGEILSAAFEEMGPHIIRAGEICKPFLEAAGYRWDEEAKEWIAPKED